MEDDRVSFCLSFSESGIGGGSTLPAFCILSLFLFPAESEELEDEVVFSPESWRLT